MILLNHDFISDKRRAASDGNLYAGEVLQDKRLVKESRNSSTRALAAKQPGAF